MVGTLCLAMAASLAVAQLSKLSGGVDGWVDSGFAVGGRWRALAGAAVIAGLVVDGMTRPVPVVPPPGKVILPGSQQAAVMELPLDDTTSASKAMYRSMFHRQPLVNGYSGHFPPHYNVLSLSLWRGDASALFYLARRRPLVIIVNDRLDHGRSFKQMIEAVPGIQTPGASGAGTMFLLPAQAAPREPPIGPDAPGQRARRRALHAGVRRRCASLSLGACAFPLRRRYEDLAPANTSRNIRGWADLEGVVARMDRRHGRRSHARRSCNWRRCESRSPASGRATCAYIRRHRG